ncbi:glycosyltransferase family 4 protein [Curtobacterium sp. 24E2]|nr:glycosyltransferase family 4 protein [Curtobacterium sp. 24E2]
MTASGVDVSVITTFPHYPAWSFGDTRPPSSAVTTETGCAVHRLRHRLPARPGGVSRLLSEVSFGLHAVSRRWARHDVLVLVSPALFSSAIALVRARLFSRGTPVVTWVQDIYSLGLRETGSGTGPAERFVAAIERWVLKRSSTVVVIHDRFMETVVEEFGVPASRVTVMRNWTHVEPPEFVDRVGARASLGWAPDETIVLHAGNMGVKQGLGNVVEAARSVQDRGLPIRFVLLGDGNQRESLQQQAAGIDSLQFLAPLPDDEFAAALNSADVLLVNEAPGISGMAVPSKLTTYFATGVPVLAASDEGASLEPRCSLRTQGSLSMRAGRLGSWTACSRSSETRLRGSGTEGTLGITERLTSLRLLRSIDSKVFFMCSSQTGSNPVLPTRQGPIDEARAHHGHHRTGRLVPG